MVKALVRATCGACGRSLRRIVGHGVDLPRKPCRILDQILSDARNSRVFSSSVVSSPVAAREMSAAAWTSSVVSASTPKWFSVRPRRRSR